MTKRNPEIVTMLLALESEEVSSVKLRPNHWGKLQNKIEQYFPVQAE